MIGFDFGSKWIQINDILMKNIIWNAAEQELFNSIIKDKIKNMDCIYLSYDIYSNK